MKKTFTSKLWSLLTLFILIIEMSLYNPSIIVAASDKTYKKGVVQQTSDGSVRGYNDGKALVWKGIPYAKAPTGDLRWRAPQKNDIWKDTRDATKDGPSSIQGSGDGAIGEENGLNLNIFRPNNAKTNLPVFVYIHGGNNQFGSSAELPGSKLAVNTEAIIIPIQTRLGLLGFINLPSLKTGNPLEDSGNYTLLDISAALDWIKDNIEYFGGDPNNITISGFSAGGRDVLALLISPLFEGKIQKAYSFSGGLTLADVKDSQKVIASQIAKLVVEDELAESEEEATKWLLSKDEKVKDYLYGLPASRLAALVKNAQIRLSGFPHLFKDGTVIPKEGFNTKNYNSIPVVLLASKTEFSLFAISDPYFAEAAKNKTFLTDPNNLKEIKFAIKHGSRLYEYFNAEEAAKTIFNKYNAPIYSVDILWGTNKNIVGEEFATLYGAAHGIFRPFLSDEPIGLRATFPKSFENNGVKDLTRVFQAYLKNFLYTGNPNGTGLVHWEQWKDTKSGHAQLVLDADKDKAIVKQTYNKTTYRQILSDLKADKNIPEESKKKIISTVLNGRWFSNGLDKSYKTPSLWKK
jgi:para-nitrobenzyl esterase